MENQHVKRILEEDYDFNFGDYISEGFKILGKNLGGFVVFGLLAGIIIMISSIIPILGSIANSLVLTPALIAGIYIVANMVDREEDREFGDFFKGFNYVPQLALVALVTGLFTGLALIPFGLANVNMAIWVKDLIVNSDSLATNPDLLFEGYPGFSGWTTILLLPSIYLSIAYAWAPLFVVFHKLNFWDAMEASRIIITKKWFLVFLFSIVIGLIAVLGFLGFCIGILFTYPAAMCMVYAAFADVTRLNEIQEGGMDIADHLVE